MRARHHATNSREGYGTTCGNAVDVGDVNFLARCSDQFINALRSNCRSTIIANTPRINRGLEYVGNKAQLRFTWSSWAPDTSGQSPAYNRPGSSRSCRRLVSNRSYGNCITVSVLQLSSEQSERTLVAEAARRQGLETGWNRGSYGDDLEPRSNYWGALDRQNRTYRSFDWKPCNSTSTKIIIGRVRAARRSSASALPRSLSTLVSLELHWIFVHRLLPGDSPSRYADSLL